jgi:hypothetical protein
MKTSLMCASAAALCLLAAACGSASAPSAPQGAQVASQRGAGPTLAGNRRLARAEAAKLLTLVPVPAGARRLRSAPVSALSYPGITGQADAERSWRLGMPFAAASAWIAAHRPAGLRQTASGSGGPPAASGYTYAGPDGPAWGTAAELDIEVVQAGTDGSYLRADGYVAWLDPVPYRDTATGPRLRVLASGRCPATDSGIVGVRNPSAHLARTLLPAGPPAAALQCAYYGMNGKTFRLKAQQRLRSARARALATAIGRIPVSHLIGVDYHCPMDDGSAVLVAFAYPGHPDVDVWAEVTGCPAMSNGYIDVAAELP